MFPQQRNISSAENVEIDTCKSVFVLFQKKTDKNPSYLFGSAGKTENNWTALGKMNRKLISLVAAPRFAIYKKPYTP